MTTPSKAPQSSTSRVWLAAEMVPYEGIQEILGIFSTRDGAIAAAESHWEVETREPQWSRNTEPASPLRWEGDSAEAEEDVRYKVKPFEVQP